MNNKEEELKKSFLQRLRQEMADEIAIKRIDPKSKEAQEYGKLDTLSAFKKRTKELLEELPEDEGIENIYTTTIPQRFPGMVEYRKFKKQSSDEPSLIESTRGTTLNNKEEIPLNFPVTAREVLSASEERSKTPKFTGVKDIISRSPAAITTEEPQIDDLTEQDIKIGKEYYSNPEEYYNLRRLMKKK